MSDQAELEELKRRLENAEAACAKHAAVEEAMRASQENYKAVFDAIDVGLCLVEILFDDAGNAADILHLDANPAYERHTGLKDIVGKRALEIAPEAGPWLEFYGQVARTGRSARIEPCFLIGRWITVHATKVGGEESRKVAIVFNDVTDRTLTEQALRESETRHRLLVESWTQAVWETDAAGVVAVDSPSWRSYTGQTREEWLGFGWLNAIHPDDRAYAEQQWRDATANQLVVNAEFRVRAPNGRWRWTNVLAAPVLDARGLIDKWAGLNIDIDARMRAEQALRRSEELFKRFAASSSDVLWIRDARTLAHDFISEVAQSIFGVAAEALLSDPTHGIAMIVPEDREDVLKNIAKVRNGKSVVHEYRIQRADGSFRWMRSTGFPLTSEGLTIEKIGGITADVTEAKLAAEHQAVLLAELQHRVRNIMAIVQSMVSRSAASVADVDDYRIRLEGRLLALARVQTLLTREANCGGWLHMVLESEINAQAQHRDQYVIEGPSVRLSPKAVEILTLAFHELAANAVKYGGLAVAEGRLRVSWTKFEKRGSEWLAIRWEEEGAPPRPISINRGFGSELIEARIPYELRGRGEMTLGPGGARCILEFPLRDSESILETDAPERNNVFGGMLDMTDAPDLSGCRVLIVEDDYYQASDVAAALRGAGAMILGPCPDAETTFDLLQRVEPTHAVLDLNLGDGGPQFDLAHALRARGVPIIFSTGYDPEAIPAELVDVLLLQKPTPPIALVEAISRLTN